MPVDWMQRFTQEVDAGDQRSQAFSDEQRKQKISQYMTASNNMHKSLALLLNPDTMQPMPGKEQQAAQIRQQLSQVDSYINQLYNPKFNPASDRMNEDPLHKLTDKLHLTKPPAENKNAAQQMQDLQGIRDKYGDTASPILDEQAKQGESDRRIEHVRALGKKYGMSDQAIGDITEKMLGVTPKATRPALKLYKLKNGEKAWLDASDPDSLPEGAEPIASGTQPKPRKAWGKDANGKFFSVLVDPFTNKEIPDSRNFDEQPPASLTGRITTGFFHYVDENNQVHQIQETHTSMPANGGGSLSPSGSSGKSGSPKSAAPKTSGDRILGKKTGAVVVKAQKDYVDAVRLSSIADQVAANPNDAINQKRLAVALERASAGRFTTQALDYIIKAGWGNTIEQWAQAPTTGALPGDVVRQLVDGAHQLKQASKDALDEARRVSGGDSDEGKTDKSKKTRKPLSSFGG